MPVDFVSILMPMYNAENTVLQAISSIQWQTHTDWELIISDDGSTDRSLEIALSVRDHRVRVIQNPRNEGISTRLNQAFKLSKGSFVARMDADDIAFPERLERQLKFLRNNHEVGLVGSSYVTFDDTGQLGGVILAPPTHERITAKPWGGIYVAHPTWLARRTFFECLTYRSDMNHAEDQDVLLRVHRSSLFANLPEILLGYRQARLEWKKVRKARSVFLRAALDYGTQTKNKRFMILAVVTYGAKYISDTLSLRFRLQQFSRQSAPIPSSLAQQWEVLWARLQVAEEAKGSA